MSDQLHVGSAILAWIKDLPRSRATNPKLTAIAALPVIDDSSLHSGAWELRRHGEAVKTGQIGPTDRTTAYIPGRGFISFNPATLEPPELSPRVYNFTRSVRPLPDVVAVPDTRSFLNVTGI